MSFWPWLNDKDSSFLVFSQRMSGKFMDPQVTLFSKIDLHNE